MAGVAAAAPGQACGHRARPPAPPPWPPQVPMNETVSEVELHLELSTLPAWKFMIFTQVEGLAGWAGGRAQRVGTAGGR